MRTVGKIAMLLALLLTAAALLLWIRTADRGTGTDSAGSAGLKGWVDFTLPDTGGEQVSLNRFIGKKPVLLVFWATWCPRCNESVPVINQWQTEPPARDLLQILALDFMESREKVQDYIREKGVAFPVLLDRSGSVAREYRVVGIPTYVLIDRNGEVAYRGHDLPEISRYVK